jgi:hypothetical protein
MDLVGFLLLGPAAGVKLGKKRGRGKPARLWSEGKRFPGAEI